MSQALTMAAIFCATMGVIWTGVHFGSKWIDAMLCYRPADLSKPIVRPRQS
jgi:hypothetical protein